MSNIFDITPFGQVYTVPDSQKREGGDMMGEWKRSRNFHSPELPTGREFGGAYSARTDLSGSSPLPGWVS